MSSQNDYLLSSHYETYAIRNKICLGAEHSYFKFDWNCDESLLPTIYLFMKKKCRHFSYSDDESNIANSNILERDDVEIVESAKYDEDSAQHSMEECERYASMARIDGEDEAENPYSKSILSSYERRLYRKIVGVLKSDQLARLAYKKLPNEAILRRIALNRSSLKIKKLLSSIEWDPAMTSKIHMKLVTSICPSLFPIYFDILQTLMAQVPKLVDSLLRTHMSRLNVSANEAVDLLLSMPWCPVTDHLMKQTLTLHPSIPRPTFLIIRDVSPSKEWKKRWRFISRQLTDIGRVIKVLDIKKIQKFSPEELTDASIRCLARKIAQIRSSKPNSPIVLIGRSYGSTMACEVTNVERIDAVACLGFPMPHQNTCAAKFNIPTLFFVGENDRSCSIEKLEKFRATIRSKTGLVVVGGADEQLRINQSRQLIEEVVQPMVDRCLLEKLAAFLNNILRESPRYPDNIEPQPPD